MSELLANNKKRLAVLAILLVFAAPAFLSWWLVNHTDYGRNNASASHGALIVPPRPIQDTALIDPLEPGRKLRLHGKWNILYLHEGACGKDCFDNLYKMRQIRLATGKYAPRIQRVLVFDGENTGPLIENQKTHFSGQLFLRARDNEQLSGFKIFRMLNDENPILKRRIYIVDPLGNLMMSYAADAEPSGIIKDLNRLLRYSRIG